MFIVVYIVVKFCSLCRSISSGLHIAVLNATITATVCQCHDPSRECMHESMTEDYYRC